MLDTGSHVIVIGSIGLPWDLNVKRLDTFYISIYV